MITTAAVITDTLQSVHGALGAVVSETLRDDTLCGVDDEQLLALLAQAAAIGRLADAMMIEAVAQVQDRADGAPHLDRLTTRRGCRSVQELAERVTRRSSRAVADLRRGGRAILRPLAPTSGERLPADFPAMRAALADGCVGLEGLVAVTGTLEGAACPITERLAADEELAAVARGEGADGAAAPGADDLRLQAQVWATFLDQDGSEPRESRAMRKRGFTLGECRDGLVRVRGELLTEVAAQFEMLFHSVLNPKVDGPEAPSGPHFVVDDGDGTGPVSAAADVRSRAQRQHDALASILAAAARSGELPTLGGAAPTLVVSVSERELRAGVGHAHVDGYDEPLPLSVARQIACSGGVQRVTTDEKGRIRAIHTFDRVFDAHQRKALALRDGGCIIPGCRTVAAWCEIHHVTEHAAGGPTHTDNGVLLCWFHHRTLDSGGWKIRMNAGVPEVRGPYWWDAAMLWRPVTRSPVRMRERLNLRRE